MFTSLKTDFYDYDLNDDMKGSAVFLASPFSKFLNLNSYLFMTIKEMPTGHSNHVHNFCKEEITRPTDLLKMKIKLCQTFLCKSFCNIFCKHCQEHLDRITAGGWGWGVYQKLQIL